eukprot:comp11925_c0_seq1/m.6588 comp11925_c0_seq1/g.6588  ORF comp11925_c0_seq1/g.6588 comp11925_c0_seq1/m.6588 type:complete len:302 (-) comp11925_c0_seq1:407-1312(-)
MFVRVINKLNTSSDPGHSRSKMLRSTLRLALFAPSLRRLAQRTAVLPSQTVAAYAVWRTGIQRFRPASVFGARQLHSTLGLEDASKTAEYDKACEQLIKCWSCEKQQDPHPAHAQDAFFCPGCGAVQPPHPHLSHFATLDMRPTYDLDTSQLHKNFRRLQAIVHPDKFSGRSKEQQRNSAMLSSHLNRAFSTLRDPLNRGLYMLEQHGLGVEEGEKISDMGLLMEIMEVNEALEDAHSLQEVQELGKRNAVKLEEAVQAASKAFKAGDLQAAKQALVRLRFYSNVAKSVIYWQPGQPVLVH